MHSKGMVVSQAAHGHFLLFILSGRAAGYLLSPPKAIFQSIMDVDTCLAFCTLMMGS